jgi:hypothetical protein
LNDKSGVVFRVIEQDVKNNNLVGETAQITFDDLISGTSHKPKDTTLNLIFNG